MGWALLSTLNLAALNVFSKQLLSSHSAITLLHLLSKLTLLAIAPLYCVGSLFLHHNQREDMAIGGGDHVIVHMSISWLSLGGLLALDGLMAFGQNLLAFSILARTSSLTYSICNSSKRVAVISLAFVFFPSDSTRVSSLALFGILLSLSGVFLYNLSKHLEKDTKKESKPYSYSRLPTSNGVKREEWPPWSSNNFV